VLTAREDVSDALKEGAVGTGTRSWRTRLGEVLVVLQICVGTLLMTAAVLLSISLLKLLRTDFGFDADRVVVAKLSLPSNRYTSAEQRQAFADELLERAHTIPNVRAAAWSSGIPMDGGMIGSIETPGRQQPEGIPPVWTTFAGSEYFQTLGMTLVRGRNLEENAGGDAREVVVNQAFASAYFPGTDPLGQTVVYYPDINATIVGVVSDVRQGSVREAAEPQIYAPATRGTHFSVRTAGDPDPTIAMLRDAIRDLDPELPIDRLRLLEGLMTESVARERFYTVLLNGFALISLLITLLGTYGLASYTVSRRNKEIGIRLALGASGHHVHRALLGRTAMLALVGILLGLAGASATTRLLQAYLYGISARDPVSFGLVGLMIAAVAILAAYGPARRAARIDPMVVLRAE
jgi:predicted permease